MSLAASLQVRGFRLRPWPRCTTHTMFDWQNFDGLLVLDPKHLVIIALMTDRPGSGRLGALMEEFESAARENDVHITVTHFWNERLRDWFARRGYHIGFHKELGIHAVWSPLMPAQKL